MNLALRSIAAAALLAAAATAANAQSSVKLYGLVDIGAGQFEDNNNDSGGSYFNRAWAQRWKVEPGMMTTSFWGMEGKEDLGNGVAAEFKLEAFFLGDTGAQGRFQFDTLFARSAYIGLTSKDLGTVRMGRNTTPLFISTLIFNPFGDSFVWSPSIRQYFNGSAGGQLRGDSGWNNSVNYLSPNYGGLSINALISAGEGAPVGATTGTGKNYSVSALWFGGPFAATAAWQSVEQTNAGTNAQDSWQLGGSWDLTFVKLFGQYGEVDDGDISGVKARIWAASASVPLGAGKILGSYGESSFSGTGSGKRITASLGYNYALSKRTDVTAAVMGEEVQAGRAIDFASFKPVAGSIATIDNDGVSYGINIRHRF
ncbi:porin [Rivibacter subsaxonicus]|uniref:Putative porin n=1 Tax=Rivibacter subsaxonicus TaxID=457575 RepID=A0A4Q7VX20_9BURK|nr:porin [Rivibacter subsaxonicus]RZU01240.1 putative porin [Rivibacter subsaxonicus]